MPLRTRDSTRPVGVFELYQSYAPVAADVRSFILPFAGLLLAALVAPLGRALPARPAHGSRASSATALPGTTPRRRSRRPPSSCASRRRWRRSDGSPAASRTTSTTSCWRSTATPTSSSTRCRRAPAALRARDPVGRRARRGADAPAARVQPQAGPAAARAQPERSVREIETMLRRLIGEDVRVVLDLEPTLRPVEADPSQIDQVLLNLAVNARDAMDGRGRLRIATRNDGDAVAARGLRQRRRHGRGDAGAHLRAVLHDEGRSARARASASRPSTASSRRAAARSRCAPRRAAARPSRSACP